MNIKDLHRSSRESGFTLIELMIVIAIIGILAAVAVPAYQDYVVRSKVSEAFVAATEPKVSVQEYVTIKSAYPSDNSEAGISMSTSFKSTYVSTIAISGSGLITVTLTKADDLKEAQGKTLVLTPDKTAAGKVSWECSATMSKSYLPANCR